MKSSRNLRWMLGAAVSFALAATAGAQYRVGGDGTARDANTRIGSGGSNFTPGQVPLPNGYIGNNLVTGNITAGRHFRGFVPYGEPGAFRGNASGVNLDNFVRGSSGVPTRGGIAPNNAQVVQPFFGDSRAAPPPVGFTQQSVGSGAYVPAPVITRGAGDLRLGQPLDASITALPQPGQLVLPGQVDPNTQTSSMITASPLYGVRRWDLADASNRDFLNNLTAPPPGVKMDAALLEQMRREVTEPRLDQPIRPGQVNLSSDPLSAFESPRNEALSNATENMRRSGDAASGDIVTGSRVRQRLLTSPQQQSTQYAELQKRLQQYKVVQQQTESAAGQEYNRQVREQAETQAAQQPGAAQRGPAGVDQRVAGSAEPEMRVPPLVAPPTQRERPQFQPQPPQQPTGITAPERPKPLKVRSLAEGVQAKGLADLLKEAEDMLKAGRYNSALEQYELAEQVAPNNPFILLGRANAELGQSYYTRADAHLREAFMKDQALLMGQYDVAALLGNERLDFVVRDLSEIANRETKESRPLFLLAYIHYNTGNERKAAAYLDLADKRSGGNDPLFALLRKHWALPQDQPADNK